MTGWAGCTLATLAPDDVAPVATLPARTTRLLVASTEPVSFVDGPGTRFTMFLQGCNLDCFNCHNPSLIDGNRFARWRTIGEIIDELVPLAPFLSGVTVSGGEATLQLDGVTALFRSIKDDARLHRLSTLVDTNGTLGAAGWRQLAPVMDGAMVDVKAVDEELHRQITGRSNRDVLASVRTLHELERLIEVRLLVIEGLTDQRDELERYAAFVASVDAAVPVRLMAFRHQGVRAKGRRWPETAPGTVTTVASTLRELGLSDVREPSVS